MYSLKSKLQNVLVAGLFLFSSFAGTLGLVTINSPAASAQIKRPVIIAAADPNDCKGDPATHQVNKDNCKIIGYIVLLIQVLSAIVGIVVVIMIIVGGIQYSASGDDPQAVAAAKKRIMNAVIAIVFYIFGFAILQYLVPGGVL